MKLQRLKISSPFRSLVKEKEGDEKTEPFEIQFRPPFEHGVSEEDWQQFHPFCFAGLNGSGKSNVLEALANIFYHLDNCVNVNQPKNFENDFKSNKSSPDEYELEYFIVPKEGVEFVNEEDYSIEKLWKVSIKKEANKNPVLKAKAYPFDENSKEEIPRIIHVIRGELLLAKKYLPSLVIGYSSGENEILSIPFLKTRLLQYDEYEDALIGPRRYKEPESSLIYIDYEMSQAVLLSNLIFYRKKEDEENSDNENDDEKDVLRPIRKELKIRDIARFRMHLRNHKIETEQANTSNFHILDPIISSENQHDDEDKIIDKFKNCATCYFEKDGLLVLDFWVNDVTKEAFKVNFDNIFNLFQAFQLLYTLNYRFLDKYIKTDVYQSKGYYTDGKIPEPSPGEQVFYFLDYFVEKERDDGKIIELLVKNLSDGEQQFLHSLGICLMLKGRNALLLLDEPETHFNPDWRSKFIRTLKNSLELSNSNNLMRDILITSHSPFIISDCFPDKVIVFEKGKQPVNARDINFRTYGTSIDIIMENIFKKNNTIGDLARSEIEQMEKEIANFESLTEEEVLKYKKEAEHLGDSMEKILLFAQLNELKKK